VALKILERLVPDFKCEKGGASSFEMKEIMKIVDSRKPLPKEY
jgi:hypothetical protein